MGLIGVVHLVDTREVHVVLVVLPMAGTLPQAAVEHDGGLDLFVARGAMLGPPVVEKGVDHPHALGVEEGESRALVVEAEEVEFPAELAVVALLGHLQPRHVLFELLLRGEGGTVDAGEHGVVGVAAPVGAGRREHFDGRDAPGVGHVRTAAQVDEVAVPVDADGLVFRQVADELDLVGLGGEELQGLLPTDLLPTMNGFAQRWTARPQPAGRPGRPRRQAPGSRNRSRSRL